MEVGVMATETDLLQDIKKVREAEVKFYETIVNGLCPLPRSQHPQDSTQQELTLRVEGRARLMMGMN